MCGGSGKRLWPLSRARRPKQFLPLTGRHSLFQETVLRMSGAVRDVDFTPPLIISGARHEALVEEELRAIGVRAMATLLEPEARDTGAAIAASCAHLVKSGKGDSVMLVSPCDHAIGDVGAFHASLAEAARLARTGAAVIFGIEPDHPATGYGYIKRGRPDGNAGFAVERFLEKPDRDTARRLLGEGGYLWNAGMFVFTAERGLHAVRTHAPQIAEAAELAVERALSSGGRLQLDAAAFSMAPKQPFDIAVMEKISGARVLPARWGWSDVGSWAAVHALAEKSPEGNAAGPRDVLEDCNGVLAVGDGVTVTALGVSDLVIVATRDAVFVAPRGRSEELKRIVSRLEDGGREELL